MSWTETDGTSWQLFYFNWGPARTLRERVLLQCAKTHRPEHCLPATGLELREQFGVKDSFDIQENIGAGAKLLKGLLTRYTGDLSLGPGVLSGE